ncbi:MAG: hypothetical protein IIX54_03310 [Clostridia bacterium]|nr:hypothetical protein [Clostridia bacterium]
MKICIIGQSKRLKILENNLTCSGYIVECIYTQDDLANYIDADLVVLPIPTLNKDGYINISGKENISPNELINKISPSCKIISCGYNDSNRISVDLNERDDFAYLNAVPTAEGAIYYAISSSELALDESEILITGFGRVAKILTDRLKGLCRNITIAARSARDLSYATALGYNTIRINELYNEANRFNIIFQTVPSPIFDERILGTMNDKNTIIELSSKFIGTDIENAKKLGINVIQAPALPEKILPQTAGNILTKCILSIIAE